jgi:hypothetical protein
MRVGMTHGYRVERLESMGLAVVAEDLQPMFGPTGSRAALQVRRGDERQAVAIMKILFTIAHFFDPKGDGRYGSTGPNEHRRLEALSACLKATEGLFSRSHEIKTVICTTGNYHLLGQLHGRTDCYTHQHTNVQPKLLGFECQSVLAKHLGNYDYYCFLEDDLVLHDGAFFEKLSAFTGQATFACLLQPNRYEESEGAKYYIDAGLHSEVISGLAPFVKARLPSGKDRIIRIGSTEFCRAANPHSGCYFLNAKQMAHWASQPYFAGRDTSFVGPLESAATLGILRALEIYKPSSANWDFLEIQHFDAHYYPQRH